MIAFISTNPHAIDEVYNATCNTNRATRELARAAIIAASVAVCHAANIETHKIHGEATWDALQKADIAQSSKLVSIIGIEGEYEEKIARRAIAAIVAATSEIADAANLEETR